MATSLRSNCRYKSAQYFVTRERERESSGLSVSKVEVMLESLLAVITEALGSSACLSCLSWDCWAGRQGEDLLTCKLRDICRLRGTINKAGTVSFGLLGAGLQLNQMHLHDECCGWAGTRDPHWSEWQGLSDLLTCRLCMVWEIAVSGLFTHLNNNRCPQLNLHSLRWQEFLSA